MLLSVYTSYWLSFSKEVLLMIILLSFLGITVFLFGLYQWASGGAALWRIFSIRKSQKDLTPQEKLSADREIHNLEHSADRAVSNSFRIIAGLAVVVWLFLGLQMLLELFGINMIGKISTTAHQYWAQPQIHNSNSPTQMRNDMLRNMGNNLRR